MISSSNEDSNFFRNHWKFTKRKKHWKIKIGPIYWQCNGLTVVSCYLFQYSLFRTTGAEDHHWKRNMDILSTKLQLWVRTAFERPGEAGPAPPGCTLTSTGGSNSQRLKAYGNCRAGTKTDFSCSLVFIRGEMTLWINFVNVFQFLSRMRVYKNYPL